jgi:hypothetical protein
MPRLAFTLRDVFWLTLVVGLAVAWYLQNSRASLLQNRLDDITAELASRNIPVEIDRDGVWIGFPAQP